MESPYQALHPYWRMDYITAEASPKLAEPFTALPALGDDRAALIVHRTRLSYLMLNRFPYNPGHLLAIPFRSVADLPALTTEESADLMAIIVFAERLLRATMRPDGFNIGFNLGAHAGGSIAHLHGHVVPRWAGDNNFMPVTGQTRILPEALARTWEKLHAAAAALAAASSLAPL
jgi:ATP adenylyltransferase